MTMLFAKDAADTMPAWVDETPLADLGYHRRKIREYAQRAVTMPEYRLLYQVVAVVYDGDPGEVLYSLDLREGVR